MTSPLLSSSPLFSSGLRVSLNRSPMTPYGERADRTDRRILDASRKIRPRAQATSPVRVATRGRDFSRLASVWDAAPLVSRDDMARSPERIESVDAIVKSAYCAPSRLFDVHEGFIEREEIPDGPKQYYVAFIGLE